MTNLTITHTPAAIALSDNDLLFKVVTDNYLQSAGTKAHIAFYFNSIPAVGDYFRIVSDYFDLTFTFVDGTADNSGLQINRNWNELFEFRTFMLLDLQKNYYINKYFNVTHGIDTDIDYVKIEAKEVGDFNLAQPDDSTDCPAMLGPPYYDNDGANKTYRNNYRLEGKLSILDFEDSIIPTHDTQEAAFNYKKMPELQGGFAWPETLGTIERPDMIAEYRFQVWENDNSVRSAIFKTSILKVLQGGVSKKDYKSLIDAESTWYEMWQENQWFLTWQPNGHVIDLNSTLKLYHLSTYTGNVRLYWKINGDPQNVNFIALDDLLANTVYEIIASPGLLFSFMGSYITDLEYFDLWLEKQSDGTVLSETRRYYIDWQYCEFRREFLFSNSYRGAYDTLRFTGKGSESWETESYTYEHKVYDEELKKINQSRSKLSNPQKTNTGWISREVLEYMQEFLLSEDRYEIRNGKLYPVYITSSKITKRADGEYIYSLEIEFQYSFNEEYFSSVDGIQEQSNPVSGGSNFIPQIGGAGGGHVIIAPDGTEMQQRAYLKFIGAGVTVTDDEGNNQTIVEIEGGKTASDRLYMFNKY
ncbi:MAG: hypothetical protein PF448_13145 [Bacteroidales bacterium]|jgi:hypothetical protein|nr:hypothetical protein [Bacteroidales bacterium]